MNPPSSPWVKDVTEETFEADVLLASDETPVVVDFWSPSCAPCRTLGPLLERLTNERKGKVVLAKVNTDDNPQLASYFRIDAIPAVKVVYHRQLVHEFTGVQPEKALRQFFDEICPDDRDPELLKAMAAEEAAPARAEKLYRTLLAKDAERHDARVGLGRTLLRLGRLDEIAEVLEPVGTAGDLGAESEGLLARVHLVKAAKELPDEPTLRRQLASDANNATAHLQLGTHLAARGVFEQALQHLYTAAELNFQFAQGKAREVMVKVFYAIGPNHPLANDYRSKLSRLLY